MKCSYRITAKAIPDVNNLALHGMQELRDYLHVKHNFWFWLKEDHVQM